MNKGRRIAGEAARRDKKKNNTKHEADGSSEIFASCSFSSLGLPPALCDQLKERLGFEVPTHVQAEAIPVILSGRHALINAATGTGKTLAYLAPIIHFLQQYDPRVQRSDGTFALVLVPTRELCMQVYEILQKLLHRFHWIVPGYIMGGENRSKEKARLRKGISVLVATPGRLLDHLRNTTSFLYTTLRFLVFDEADRILELGFGKDIEEILGILDARKNESTGKNYEIPRNFKLQKQNLLLSATLNEKVNHLAKISLEDPVLVGLNNQKKISYKRLSSPEVNESDGSKDSGNLLSVSNEEYKFPVHLVQKYVKVSCASRLVALLSVLKNLFERETSQKVVVFLSTCDSVDFHYALLSEFQWHPRTQSETEAKQLFGKCKTFKLHGNMKHDDRRSTFQAFQTDTSGLLLSTDVAARGLDFPKVRCIIQYDSPGEATEYVHRVGRTARLGERGDSLLFLQPIEIDYLQDLEKHGVYLKEYPLLKLLDNFSLFGIKPCVKKFVSLEMHPWVLRLQKALESLISSEPRMKKLAKTAFCSWVRAYTAHRGELKRIFLVKKLHLGHVAKSFALKEQPSLVSKSIRNDTKKRQREQRPRRPSKKKRVA